MQDFGTGRGPFFCGAATHGEEQTGGTEQLAEGERSEGSVATWAVSRESPGEDARATSGTLVNAQHAQSCSFLLRMKRRDNVRLDFRRGLGRLLVRELRTSDLPRNSANSLGPDRVLTCVGTFSTLAQTCVGTFSTLGPSGSVEDDGKLPEDMEGDRGGAEPVEDKGRGETAIDESITEVMAGPSSAEETGAVSATPLARPRASSVLSQVTKLPRADGCFRM